MRRLRIQSLAAFGMAAGALALVVLGGCKEEELQYARPPFVVVEGTPAVDEDSSTVDYRPPEASADDFSYSAGIRVDVFRQDTVRKVDILWMVDNSPSMTAVQDNLAANFASFIQDLAHADPPVDYHIAVVTPDTPSEGGALRPVAGHEDYRYIACNSPELASDCNIGSLLQAKEAFQRTVTVGADGLPVERGLLAVHMALSEPMASTTNDGFLREDASLYVIMVSDEGDASCDPVLPVPQSGDYLECTFYPDCRCADDENLSFGDVDYFVRFLRGIKGYGNEESVSVAAIVGDYQEEIRLCVRSGESGCAEWADYRGCRNQTVGMHALYAPRYTEVAQRTGGITVSICEEDYSSALSEIGFAASGQERDFPLSRVPMAHDIEPFRVTIITEEDGRQTRENVPHKEQEFEDGWSYVGCDGQIAVNSLRFHGRFVPPPNARIEVVYHVDAGGIIDCD